MGTDDQHDQTAMTLRLGWALQHLAEAVHALSQRFARQEKLHTTDVRALGVLAAAGRPLTSGELARRLDLTTSATTRVVDRLHAAGHVARQADEHDRRLVVVEHTPRAQQAARSWFGPLTQRLSAALRSHDPATREAIVSFLETVVDEIDATGERRPGS